LVPKRSYAGKDGFRETLQCNCRKVANQAEQCSERHGLKGRGKRLYFAKNPEMRPSVAKANADFIDLIGTAKAMPLQN